MRLNHIEPSHLMENDKILKLTPKMSLTDFIKKMKSVFMFSVKRKSSKANGKPFEDACLCYTEESLIKFFNLEKSVSNTALGVRQLIPVPSSNCQELHVISARFFRTINNNFGGRNSRN